MVLSGELTAGVDCKAALRGLTGRSHSGRVAGCNPELVLSSFDKAEHCILQPFDRRLGDRGTVDAAPVHGTALSLLQPVALDSGAAIVQGRVPCQGHGGGCGSHNLRIARRSGEAKRILELDFL